MIVQYPSDLSIMPGIPEMSRRVREFVGLDFPERKWDMLQRGVVELAADLNFSDPGKLLLELLQASSGDEIFEQLVTRLTIGETYFLRDKPVFEALREHILPHLARDGAVRKDLGVWCMAASSGEEPYSIAMLIDERPDLFAGWRVRITGCDINPEVLAKARNGVYSEWSLRATPEDVRQLYFKPWERGLYRLTEHIRKMVEFHQLNLAEENFVVPEFEGRAADLIFCRNVLIYFPPEVQARVLSRLNQQLRRGGWLLVAPSEVSVVSEPGLELVHFPGAIAFRKHQVGGSEKKVSGPRTRLESARRARPLQARPTVSNRPVRIVRKAVTSAVPQPSSGGKRVVSGKDTSQPNPEDLGSYLERLLGERDYLGVVELLEEYEPERLVATFDYARICACRARALASLGQLEAARDAANEALEADLVDPYCCYLVATIAGELGDYEQAADFCRRALFLESDFIMAHFSRAMFLKRLKRSGSRRHLQQVLKLLEEVADESEVKCGEGLAAGRLREITQDLLEEVGG